ncbi:MAG: hypothetical protein RIC35_23305 [Marinoscillum sp.]
MNKQKFVEYLRTPAKLDQKTLAELEEVVNEFPYFQNARTLLAKGSKQNKSKKSASLIGTAALYATDRALLKRYINDQLIFLNPLEVHESHEPEREIDLTDNIKSNRIVSAHVKQTSSEEKAPPKKKPIMRPQPEAKEPAPETPLANPEETPTAPSSDLDHIIDELYRDMEELKVNRAKFQKIENQLAEEEEFDNAVKKATDKASKKEGTKEEKAQSGKQATEKHEATAAETEEAKEDVKPEEKAKSEKTEPTSDSIETGPLKKASESRSARRISSIEPEEEDKAEPKKKTTKKTATKKTTPKKSAAKKSTSAKPTGKSATTKSTSKKDTSKKSTGKSTSTSKPGSPSKTDKKGDGEKKEDKGDRKSHQDEIITNFIKVNPSISPGDSNAPRPTNSVDLSGNSTELHPDIASEYLAEIYLEQGRTERAIQIYESLMVRIPEKSVYFADIIKKLNEEK